MANETEWTLGPWTLTHRHGHNLIVQAFEVRGVFADQSDVYPVFNKSCEAIDCGVIYTSPSDARLIAAAPELYSALLHRTEYACKGQCDHQNDWHSEECLEARAVLAKARGDAA